MSTVAEIPAPRKAPVAFYAHLHSVPGVLGKLDDGIFFLAEDNTLTPISSYAGLTVLGQVGLADVAAILDTMHGGLAAIATSRQMGV